MPAVTPDTTIVLVTGGNQGLGYETIKSLVVKHPDWHIILAGRRPQAVRAAVAYFTANGHSVSPLVIDLTSDESIDSAAREVSDQFGHLDVLINNAAITTRGFDGKRAALLGTYDTNVAGTVMVTDAFLPLLKRSRHTKRVIFVSSTLASMRNKIDAGLASPFRQVRSAAYAATKSALNMIALHYAVEYEADSTWKFVIADPGYYLKTNLDAFKGFDDPPKGAVATVKLCDLGGEDPTGTFTDDKGTVEW